MTSEHIAVFVPSLKGGGAERVMLDIAGEIANRAISHPTRAGQG